MSTEIEIPAGTVVVGFDSSEHSRRALAWAAEQAALENRILTILHAVDPSSYNWMNLEGLTPTPLGETLQKESLAMLDQARDEVRSQKPTLEVVTVVRMVDPRVALVEASEDAAMVVVGSRGRGPVARLVLGSVSAALPRHTQCPVVVIRPRRKGEEDPTGGILVGVDDTDTAPPTVEWAYRLASLRDLPLTVLHVLPWPGVEEPEEFAYDTAGFEEQRLLLDQAVSGLQEKYPDVRATFRFSTGLTDEALIQASRTRDLVVVGPHRRRPFIGRLLDTNVSRSVSGRAAGIVVVLPENIGR